VRRFDANAYVTLTMRWTATTWVVAGIYLAALAQVGEGLVVAIESDVLYPPEEQAELAAALPGRNCAGSARRTDTTLPDRGGR